MGDLKMYGWFDSAAATTPTFDPWPNAPCPHCGEAITELDVKTHSFAKADMPERSYFYRTHKTCDENVTEAERDAYLQHLMERQDE